MESETSRHVYYYTEHKRPKSQVMMVEETEYDEVLTCDHSYDNR